MAAPPGGGRTPGAARPATFAGARLLLISGAAQVSDGVHEELLSRHQGAPTALSQVRALLEAGPSGAIENVEDELGLPRGLPGKLSVVALNHRDKVGIHTCAVFCESPCIGPCRPCARSCSCQGRSISPGGREIDPEPRRRPPGRQFVLHRTSGPRPQVCRPFEPCFPAPRTRPAAAPARLHAAIPGPAATTTTTLALAILKRPFPPF